MNRALTTILCVTGALWTSSALADGAPPDKAACLNASNQAQTLRDAHKLMEARDQLRVCAQQACPGVVQKDCLTWLDAVEASLPTVVVTAKDGAGRDLFDVKVSADGQPLTTKLTGDGLPMNPGPHALHFESADGATLDQQVMVREGVKNQNVAVVLSKTVAAPAGGATPAAATPGATPAGGQPDTSPSSDSGGGIPWRTVGWVAGGVGIIGLGVGTAFGFIAISDKNGAHCDATNACDPGGLSSANSAATVSTIGVIAGGVLLAGGAALVLFGPKGDSGASPTANAIKSVKLAPLVGARDGGLLLGGSW